MKWPELKSGWPDGLGLNFSAFPVSYIHHRGTLTVESQATGDQLTTLNLLEFIDFSHKSPFLHKSVLPVR